MKEKDYTIIPLDGALLSEIECGCAALAKALREKDLEIRLLAENCQKIDEYAAAQLQVYKPAHNIKNSATELANYLGISKMLLENIRCDLNDIYNARKEWQRKEAVRIATLAENKTLVKQAAIEKERIARKRYEAKKWQRPSNSAKQE